MNENNTWIAMVIALSGANIIFGIFVFFEEAMIGVLIMFNISIFIAMIIVSFKEERSNSNSYKRDKENKSGG